MVQELKKGINYESEIKIKMKIEKLEQKNQKNERIKMISIHKYKNKIRDMNKIYRL